MYHLRSVIRIIHVWCTVDYHTGGLLFEPRTLQSRHKCYVLLILQSAIFTNQCYTFMQRSMLYGALVYLSKDIGKRHCIIKHIFLFFNYFINILQT